MDKLHKAIQLISIDKNGKCEIKKEAEELILGIKENVAIICVAGLYRTGKSYLLNRLLNRQDGFEIGPTTLSCTKGLWIWSEPISLEGKDYKILLMDTEGLGSAFEDRNETIDMEIFCLALLLSSFFIYNSMKNLDESAVESLSLLINFAKNIEQRNDKLENYSMNFPKFLWVLRDFALELVDPKGKKISATQYLENSLEILDNVSNDKETMKKNEIRKLLKTFFRDRDCYTLIRPVMDEKKLRNIDKIQMTELRPEFLYQMDTLVSLIYSGIKPKLVQGSYINGTMFVNLVKLYVEALNSKSIPDVKTSWKIVLDQQVEKVSDKCIDEYVDSMLGIEFNNKNHFLEILEEHNTNKANSYRHLKDLSEINLPTPILIEVVKKLETRVNNNLKEFFEKWDDLSESKCHEIGEELLKEFESDNQEKKDDFGSIMEYLVDVMKFIEESIPNYQKYKVIFPFIIDNFLEKLRRAYSSFRNKNEVEINELKNKNSLLESKIEHTDKLHKETIKRYEEEIKQLKEKFSNQKLDLEDKLNEKTRNFERVKKELEKTNDDMKSKIIELNSVVDLLTKQKAEKKEKNKIEGEIMELKLDNILYKLDNMKDVITKSEIEYCKKEIKLDIDEMVENVQRSFEEQIEIIRQNCEKLIIKYKNSYVKENEKIKNTIKGLFEEINDYKCNVSSQEYKIELYKEKIMSYEKEKKAQTDHADLLKKLALRFNDLISTLNNKVNN